MAVTETYELEGHVVDSLLLAKVLDHVLESGAVNPAAVTKLADRGSHQARGEVPDVGPFLRQLADALGA